MLEARRSAVTIDRPKGPNVHKWCKIYKMYNWGVRRQSGHRSAAMDRPKGPNVYKMYNMYKFPQIPQLGR